jgi:hypothetical protein
LFIGQAAFNVFSLKLCQVGLKQPAISADIIAMGAQESQFFVNHRRHPLTVVGSSIVGGCRRLPRPGKKIVGLALLSSPPLPLRRASGLLCKPHPRDRFLLIRK